jgi:hypothetical protein
MYKESWIGLKVLVRGESNEVFTILDENETNVYMSGLVGWKSKNQVIKIPKKYASDIYTSNSEYLPGDIAQSLYGNRPSNFITESDYEFR